jgi:hypothetical protein
LITTNALPVAAGKGRHIILRILSGLGTLVFTRAVGAKLAGAGVMVDMFAKVGLGQ